MTVIISLAMGVTVEYFTFVFSYSSETVHLRF